MSWLTHGIPQYVVHRPQVSLRVVKEVQHICRWHHTVLMSKGWISRTHDVYLQIS